MHPLFRLTLITAALLLLVACSFATRGVGDEAEPMKVLYVDKNGGSPADSVVIHHLRKLGLEVTDRGDFAINAKDAEGYDLIFISDSARSQHVEARFKKVSVPIVFVSPKLAYINSLSETKDDNGTIQSATTIALKDSDHPLAAGLTGNVKVYNEDGIMHYVVPGQGANVIATAPDDDKKATIFAYEKGAIDSFVVANQPVPARRVFMYFTPSEVLNHTEEGWKLFDAAIQWALDSPK